LSHSDNKKKFKKERKMVRETALTRRNASNILLIGKNIDEDFLIDLKMKGNNVSSYCIYGKQNIEQNQYILGTPYKDKKKYKYKFISDLYKLIKLKNNNKFYFLIFRGEQSIILLILLFIFFPFSILRKIFN